MPQCGLSHPPPKPGGRVGHPAGSFKFLVSRFEYGFRVLRLGAYWLKLKTTLIWVSTSTGEPFSTYGL